jgi:hypothetical protein
MANSRPDMHRSLLAVTVVLVGFLASSCSSTSKNVSRRRVAPPPTPTPTEERRPNAPTPEAVR